MTLLSPEQAAAIKTSLVVIHLVGLVLGVGAATLVDLLIVKFVIRQAITEEHTRIIEFSARVVTAGLILLWLSGIGFLAHYDLFDPVKLTNQKLWAKIAIVGVLTLNGLYIHWTVLPLVRRRIGQHLLDGISGGQRARLLASGAVSLTSWYAPLLLGAIPQLNFAVAASTILLAYASVLAAGILAARGLGDILVHRLSTVTLSRDEYEALLRQSRRSEPVLPEVAPSFAGLRMA